MKPLTAHWRTRSLLAVALALGTASVASVVWARPETAARGLVPGATGAHELVYVVPTPALSRRYGLEVVEVAAPPVFATAASSVPARDATGVAMTGCPVRVTAIVEAEDASLSFAILVGADGSSTLAGRGQRVRTSRGLATVEAIESNGVRLGIGAEGMHCAFYRTGQ